MIFLTELIFADDGGVGAGSNVWRFATLRRVNEPKRKEKDNKQNKVRFENNKIVLGSRIVVSVLVIRRKLGASAYKCH